MKRGVTTREPTFRVTRARAAASRSSSSDPSKVQRPSCVLPKSTKRSVQDENKKNDTITGGAQNKRRAVLKDVTNICRDNSYKNCIIPARIPVCKQNHFLCIYIIIHYEVLSIECYSISL